MTGLMIAAELTQRRFVQLNKDLAQFLSRRITGGKTLSLNLAQRADEGVAVLVADFAVVVAVAIVETCLAHAALHGALWTVGSRLSRDRRRAVPRCSSNGILVPHVSPRCGWRQLELMVWSQTYSSTRLIWRTGASSKP